MGLYGRTGMPLATRRLVIGLAILAWGGLAPDRAGAESWTTGGLTFSDELGDARLLGASGTGTRDDPIVLLEEITGAGPAILVVRNHRTGHQNVSPAVGFLGLSLVKVVRNGGPWSWIGFELELRRTRDQPSLETDGLSFDQPQSIARAAWADRFAHTLHEDEPFDRIRFDGGRVEPGAYLRLKFDVVDINGAAVFYLVQQPIVLLARQDEADVPPMLWSGECLLPDLTSNDKLQCEYCWLASGRIAGRGRSGAECLNRNCVIQQSVASQPRPRE